MGLLLASRSAVVSSALVAPGRLSSAPSLSVNPCFFALVSQ